ncbi:MAG: hypothetical protein IJB88_04360 [Clostridia bacterium]|nr:hypothetical protein [Clostridia bacterium]
MKKRLTRLLAICVCMIVVLSACANAPSGESTATEESKETSALELPDEESSEIEPSTPEESSDSQPVEPTYPEERETTLEKLATFETGKEGLFEYGFVYETDPSDPTIELPIHYCADAKGNVYADTRIGIVCLNDGTVLRDSGKPIDDMIVCGEELFVLYLDGEICRYQLKNGLENALLVKTYRYDMLADFFAKRLMDVGMDEPVIAVDDRFYCLSSTERLTEYQAPYLFLTDETEYMLSIVDGRFFGIGTVNGRQPWVVSAQNGIVLRVSQKNETKDGTVYESLHYGYDAQGNLQSAYLMSYCKQGDVDCEIVYDAGAVRSYQGQSVAVEKNIFNNVLSHETVAGKNGEYYLVLYYANHGEVYQVNPGYSDVEFTDRETETEVQ